jgi:CBS domain-containing protein
MKVMDIMQTSVITIQPDTEIKEIARTLFENKISGVPVVDSSGKLAGIISEGDLLHKETNPRIPDVIGFLGALIYYRGVKQYDSDFKKLIALQASEIMTRDVITINKDATIEEAATLMINRNVKRLPVMENEKMIGIISRMDVIKTLIED